MEARGSVIVSKSGGWRVSNTAGATIAAAFAKLGVVVQVKAKTRYAVLNVGSKLVASGEIEIGFINVSEVPEGLAVAGPLPGDLQRYTAYEAAVLTKGSKNAAAVAFTKFLGSAVAAATWASAKLEPATRYQPASSGR